MRLFIAVRLDDGVKEKLVQMQEQLYERGFRGRFTPRDNMHITLAFIGEYNDPETVSKLLEEIEFDPFEIGFSGIGSFSDLFWAGTDSSEELVRLAKLVRRKLADHDIPYDRKRFVPHVTLIRRATLMNGAELPEDMPEASMTVTGITLYRSDRTKQGMRYTVLCDTSDV